jgi:hypothetical protein
MTGLRKNLLSAGYSTEEAYFYEIDKKLIKRKRKISRVSKNVQHASFEDTEHATDDMFYEFKKAA